MFWRETIGLMFLALVIAGVATTVLKYSAGLF
jgi:hypothetical protein